MLTCFLTQFEALEHVLKAIREDAVCPDLLVVTADDVLLIHGPSRKLISDLGILRTHTFCCLCVSKCWLSTQRYLLITEKAEVTACNYSL